MKWPIRIVYDYEPWLDRTHGEVSCKRVVLADGRNVLRSIYVSHRLLYLLTMPERVWRHLLARMWHDRLNLQYERGYTDGLREATTEEFQRLFRSLTPAEREALLEEPSYTKMKWGQE